VHHPNSPKNRFGCNESPTLSDINYKPSQKCLFFFKDFSNQLIERPVSFSRHARAGGHPVFSAEHFWILACAGMTSSE